MAIMPLLASLPVWGAPQQKEAPAGPVPAPIIAAKRVFISNAGGGCGILGEHGYSGGPDRHYNEFYSAMQGWGRYELVTTPADADIVFEISFTCPAGAGYVMKGQSVGPGYDPQLKVVILDVKTRTVLWALIEPVELAILQGNRDKNFDRDMRSLVSSLKQLVAGPVPLPGSGTTGS
jgi:hypothetical protein